MSNCRKSERAHWLARELNKLKRSESETMLAAVDLVTTYVRDAQSREEVEELVLQAIRWGYCVGTGAVMSVPPIVEMEDE